MHSRVCIFINVCIIPSESLFETGLEHKEKLSRCRCGRPTSCLYVLDYVDKGKSASQVFTGPHETGVTGHYYPSHVTLISPQVNLNLAETAKIGGESHIIFFL